MLIRTKKKEDPMTIFPVFLIIISGSLFLFLRCRGFLCAANGTFVAGLTCHNVRLLSHILDFTISI